MSWTTSYYHFDGLGSTRMLTDENQNVTDRYVYDAFGNLRSAVGETENPFRYVGQLGYYYNEDTGTMNVRQRVYSPRIVRWLSADPIGFDGGDANLYRYVGDMPTGFVDPLGFGKVTIDADSFIAPAWVNIPALHGITILYPLASVLSFVKGDDRAASLTPMRAAKTKTFNWIEFETCGCSNISRHDAGIGQSTRKDLVFRAPTSVLDPGMAMTVFTTGIGTLRHLEALRAPSRCVKIARLSASGHVPFSVVPFFLPSIDYDYLIVTRHIGRVVEYMIVGDHDAFPGHELYLTYSGQVMDRHLFLPSSYGWTSSLLALAGVGKISVVLHGSFVAADECTCCDGDPLGCTFE